MTIKVFSVEIVENLPPIGLVCDGQIGAGKESVSREG